MKRFVTIVSIFMFLSGQAFAQSSIVTGASIEFDSKNYENAISEVGKALKNYNDGATLRPKDLAKAYAIRGTAYLEIYKQSETNPASASKYPDLALNAYRDFEENKKYDENGIWPERLKPYNPVLARALKARADELKKQNEPEKAAEFLKMREQIEKEIKN